MLSTRSLCLELGKHSLVTSPKGPSLVSLPNTFHLAVATARKNWRLVEGGWFGKAMGRGERGEGDGFVGWRWKRKGEGGRGGGEGGEVYSRYWDTITSSQPQSKHCVGGQMAGKSSDCFHASAVPIFSTSSEAARCSLRGMSVPAPFNLESGHATTNIHSDLN